MKKPTPSEKLVTILEHLKAKEVINQEQYDKLNVPVKKPVTKDWLVESLVKVGVLNVDDPLDVNVDDFIAELGSLDPVELVGFSQDLRQDRKGLTSMTPIPQKNFPIPGNVIFYAFLGMAILLVVVGSNWASISKGFSGGAPGGINIGGMFSNLIPHLLWGLKLFG